MTKPIRVFLDQSDYSTLADPARETPELKEVLRTLLRYKESQRVHFFYSATIICEMTPVEEKANAFSLRKFELLNTLCEGNSLAWHEDLLCAELNAAVGFRSADAPDPVAGTWLPAASMANELSLFEGMNRQARRQTQKKLGAMLRANKMPPELSASPLPPKVKLALLRAGAGVIGEVEVSRALAEELGNPVRLLEYLLATPDECRLFSEIIRASARDMKEVAEAAMLSAQQLHQTDPNVGAAVISSREWKAVGDSAFSSVFMSLAEHFHCGGGAPTADIIELRSPGFTTMFRTVYSALWPSLQKTTPRPPSHSDFVDALHATYAPYVDLFRADGFMAPHIKSVVSRYGTQVVQKLVNLPRAIEDRLAGEDWEASTQ